MAVFKANDLIRILYRSKIGQLISFNGFKRQCETADNPLKPYNRIVGVSKSKFNESLNDDENDGNFRRKPFDSRYEGDKRGTANYKTSNYNTHSNSNDVGLNTFERRSMNFERKPEEFRRYSDNRMSNNFERKPEEFRRYSDNRMSNNFERFPRQYGGFEKKRTPFENNFSRYNNNYYRKRPEDIGKLEKGFGTESQWFAKREVKLQPLANLSGAKILDQQVTVECGELKYKIWNKFSDIENVDSRLTEMLKHIGLDEMSPIQKYTYDILNNKLIDVLGSAETGSGKTLSYLIPILNNVLSTYPKRMMDELRSQNTQTPLALILAPTRELVQQIGDEAVNLMQLTPLRACNIIGGVSAIEQMNDVNRGCHILIATPGRLIDFLNKNIISLQYCTSLVIDEADRMLDMGFEPQIKDIVFGADLPKNEERHTSMFSATFPNDVMHLARGLLQKKFGKILVGNDAGSRDPTIPKSIIQRFVMCSDRSLIIELMKLLEGTTIKTIVFCNTKAEVDFLDSKLQNKNISVSVIHGGFNQNQRDHSLESFKGNLSKVLVATSIAARGLDIADVERVINYGSPLSADEYIHRVGRCGRMGRDGESVSLMTESNTNIFNDLTNVLKKCGQPIPEFFHQSGATSRMQKYERFV